MSENDSQRVGIVWRGRIVKKITGFDLKEVLEG
jgi:hypothetical protein